jgi:ribose transport system permease protein
MNPSVKLAGSVLLSAVALASAWSAAGLSFTAGPFPVWFGLGTVALALLLSTFDFTLRNTQRVAGVSLLLTGLLIGLGTSSDIAFGKSNLLSVLNRHGELGIICVGAALLIIIGGIDLSIGSLVGMSAVMFGLLMGEGLPPVVALVAVLGLGFLLGAGHGLLVTQLRLQAFLVTLCGMFVYRGVSRSICKGQAGMVDVVNTHKEDTSFIEQLENLRYWLTGINPDERLVFPAMLVVMLVIAGVASVFLHRSKYGRYWYAIGANEQAARYSGITTWKHKVVVFAICSMLAALAGCILFLSSGSVYPSSAGQEYELYAITAVVLGGVSLRGGEGTAIGVTLGAMVLPVVKTLMNFTRCPDEWIPWMIGLILLGGAIVDELIRRRSR